jgi:hypothetical protein
VTFTTNPLIASYQNRNHALRWHLIVAHDHSNLDQISNVAIKDLIRKRIDSLNELDAADLCNILVVEGSDTLESLSAQLTFNILCNRFTGIRFDQEGFTPSFEFIEEFPSCFDMVFVLSDDGFGVELFVPKQKGINSELIAMCQTFTFNKDQV